MPVPLALAPLFPIFADLRGRAVLVVGGGVVARRKVLALLGAGARVVVGAPVLDRQLSALRDAGAVEHRAGAFEPAWLERVWLVIAATDDGAINRAVADAGEARRLWVNVVDDAEASSVQLPARVERGPLQIAISSGGGAPMLARHVREQLEAQFDDAFGALAELLARWRPRIRERLPHLPARRRFFERLLAGPITGLLRRGDAPAAERALLSTLAGAHTAHDGAAHDSTTHDSRHANGRVALVGAGPGDPGLLTLRGLRLLNEADVILHDRLVSADVLQLARRDAERVEVGKQAGLHHVTQAQTNALMIEHARAGKRVVRLKGGDPFVFGRGGEELQALRRAGIDFEVVPGITAAVACAAYAGVPLTHRDHAQSVRFITAHCKDSLDTLDWPELAQERQTLAVYMGVAGLPALARRLIAHGRGPLTPFALIENGSRPEQRVVTGPLQELARLARRHAVQSPALLIIGEVAALASDLHWFGSVPLGGPTAVPQHSANPAAPRLADAA